VTLAERLGTALARRFDGDLLTADIEGLADIACVPAAVLVPVVDRAEPGVILTQRTDHLRTHAGQIAFPGGRIDAGEDAVAAALREAEEEIALPRSTVTVVGSADRYRTVTGYDVTPVLAVVPPGIDFRASEAEVAGVFEVPLAFLLDPAHHRPASRVWNGQTRHFTEIVWGERRVWGATAAMIVNLSRRLRWS
jgi:8-oxo-dGTP pyrophosphatase MutT (NUDIX family)